MPGTTVKTDQQIGMFDLKVESTELLAAFNRHIYLQAAVDEQEAIGEAIDALLLGEFPDPAPGKKRINIGNELIIEYEVKPAKEKRSWKITETPFTAATQDPPAPPAPPDNGSQPKP